MGRMFHLERLDNTKISDQWFKKANTHCIRVIDRQTRDGFREPLDQRYEPFSSSWVSHLHLYDCHHPLGNLKETLEIEWCSQDDQGHSPVSLPYTFRPNPYVQRPSHLKPDAENLSGDSGVKDPNLRRVSYLIDMAVIGCGARGVRGRTSVIICFALVEGVPP